MYNKELVKKEIFELLTRLYNNDSKAFDDFFSEGNEDNWFALEDSANNLDFDIDFECGATKGVIIDHDCGYVIKLPFRDRDGFDYCKAEWRNYCVAESQGLAEFFAFMDFLGFFHNYPIYIQELVDCDEYNISDRAWSSSFNSYCMNNGYDKEDAEVIDEFSDYFYSWDSCEQTEALFEEEWGADFDKLTIFFEDNHINDLHSGNLGYRGDKLILIDYSGFGWDPDMKQPEWYAILKDVI